jgi:hypothetical protein
VQDLEENEMRTLENIFFVTMIIVLAPIYWLCYWYDRYANRTSQNK